MEVRRNKRRDVLVSIACDDETSRSRFHDIRGLSYHVRTWGDAAAPPLFLLHGWMDVSASFQFLVDCLTREWHVIAPDWRGFGLSAWARDGYWFPDYYADLDALLDLYQPGAPVNLVGHSMGGNIAVTYAGLRPERVQAARDAGRPRLARTTADDAPGRLVRWLDALREPPEFRTYAGYGRGGAAAEAQQPAPLRREGPVPRAPLGDRAPPDAKRVGDRCGVALPIRATRRRIRTSSASTSTSPAGGASRRPVLLVTGRTRTSWRG